MLTDYIRICIQIFLSLMNIFLLSYSYCQNQRDTFIKEIESQRLISLLQQMFKYNHDGMIITEGDNILMHNSTFNKIFREINRALERQPEGD